LKTHKRPERFQRGQIFTSDLIFAITIFLFILVLTVVYSNQVAFRVSLREEANESGNAALLASSALVLSRGEPVNWENLELEDINSIGLADSRNVISGEKLQRLADLNASYYQEAKALLGLAKYNAWIEVTNLDGSPVGEFGIEPDANRLVSSFTRVALKDGNFALVKVKVFK